MNQILGVLAASPGLVIGVFGAFGLLIGSFLNVVIHRLPRMLEHAWAAECHAMFTLATAPPEEAPMSLSRPRSRCPQCAAPIAAHQNIPIVSYLLLGGRCRQCRTRISPRYPLVEALGGAVAALAAWHAAQGADLGSAWWLLRALAEAVFGWSLLALAAIDLDTQLLPDGITQPLLWGGLVLALVGAAPISLASAVVGAIAGYGSLWTIYWAFKLATGKEGMGYGDFKLLAALGAWLGWQALPAVVLLSSALGAVIGLGFIASGRHQRSQPMPFGPFLALAGIIAMFGRSALLGLFSGASPL